MPQYLPGVQNGRVSLSPCVDKSYGKLMLARQGTSSEMKRQTVCHFGAAAVLACQFGSLIDPARCAHRPEMRPPGSGRLRDSKGDVPTRRVWHGFVTSVFHRLNTGATVFAHGDSAALLGFNAAFVHGRGDVQA